MTDLPKIRDRDAKPRHIVRLYNPSTSHGWTLRVTEREYDALMEAEETGAGFVESMQENQQFADWVHELMKKRELSPKILLLSQ